MSEEGRRNGGEWAENGVEEWGGEWGGGRAEEESLYDGDSDDFAIDSYNWYVCLFGSFWTPSEALDTERSFGDLAARLQRDRLGLPLEESLGPLIKGIPASGFFAGVFQPKKGLRV